MNKILIVGHKNSHYKRLEEILHLCGMATGDVSRSYKMTPQQISQKILAATEHTSKNLTLDTKIIAHRGTRTKIVIKNSDIAIIDGYAQKKPKRMWNGLAFDLVLANADKHLWGWSDSQVVELLEYWAEFDEDMAFVLTYDRPHFLLEEVVKSISSTDELSNKFLDEQLNDWLAYNQALLDFYCKYPDRCILVNGEQVIHSAQSYIDSIAKKIKWQFDMVDYGQLQALADNQTTVSETVKFFLDKLLSSRVNVMAMLDILQEKANIPWINQVSAMTDLDLLKSILQEQNKRNKVDKQLRIVNQEKELLSAQLHQVQEQFERYCLEEQKKLESATQEAQAVKQAAKKQKKHFDQVNQVKRDLERQLNEQKQQAQQASADIQKENELLITQLHLVQEELEKYYLENQRLKFEQNQPGQSAKSVYYGAADRVKQDLPYRLGATMVNHSKSTKSLAKLPFALAQEYRAFQKQQEVQGELPPVEEYQDSYEAEKVKKHLSYRLGKTLVDGVKSPREILGLPIKLSREIIGFKKK